MTQPARQYKSAPAPAFYTRTCDVKIERHGKWERCDRTPMVGFLDGGDWIPLCRQCARNVLRGDYGARLRNMLDDQLSGDEIERLGLGEGTYLRREVQGKMAGW